MTVGGIILQFFRGVSVILWKRTGFVKLTGQDVAGVAAVVVIIDGILMSVAKLGMGGCVVRAEPSNTKEKLAPRMLVCKSVSTEICVAESFLVFFVARR